MPEPEDLEAAVRAWAVPDYLADAPPSSGAAFDDLGPSGWALPFDTETFTDVGQAVRIIPYQLRYRGTVKEAGIAYEPSALTVDEHATLYAFAAENGYRVLARADFIREVLLPTLVKRRGAIVTMNGPWDVSRIAVDHGPAKDRRRRMRGGFSFTVDPDDPVRIQIKRSGARAAFMRLTITAGRHPETVNRAKGGREAEHRGYFYDVGTIGGSLLGQKVSLRRLAELLNTTHQKTTAELSGPITRELLKYAMNDVQVTWECFEALRHRYAGLGLTETPLHWIHSEASIAKAYEREMGLRPWRVVQPDVPDWLIAVIMESYYGGWTVCNIRREAVPGLLLDFTAEYSTCFVLQQLWPYKIGQGFDWADEDPASVQQWVDSVEVGDVLEPAFWPKLQALVQIDPAGDRLPVRARYGGDGAPWNVAVPTVAAGPPLWRPLAAAVASKLETGRAPRIIRALRFTPRAPQTGLRPLELTGDSRDRVDPTRDDLYQRLVEVRTGVRRSQREASARGDERMAARLDALQLGMKAASSAGCYGTAIEMNVVEHATKVPVTVYRPDGTSYRTRVNRTEEPGTWFHPLIATLVAAGGRLLLAAAMRLIHDAGGTFTFCDTDGLFVVSTEDGGLVPCPGGPGRVPDGRDSVMALSHETVRSIVDRFAGLNPFDPGAAPGSILKLEPVDFDLDTGGLRELRCDSHASKRYVILADGHDGATQIAGTPGDLKRSEHGLGHLLAPDSGEGRAWIDEWWLHLARLDLGLPTIPPVWFEEPAVGRVTVTSPRDEATFRAYNRGRPYEQRIRPWSFLLTAQVDRLGRGRTGGPRSLVAPYTRDRDRIRELDWFDRGDPNHRPHRITVGEPQFVISGRIPVQSFGGYFEEFRGHPEIKMAGPDGKPCMPWTRGLLQPRTVAISRLLRLGKEANRLAEDPELVDDPQDRPILYPEPLCPMCSRELRGRQEWCSDACRKRAARRQRRLSRCGFCRETLAFGRRRWCSDLCRKRATRMRAKSYGLSASHGRPRAHGA
jgi:hypothetical protein